MGTLDKLRKVQAERPKRGDFSKVKGIFHTWKEGSNIIRLAGEFVEVRTHFIAPAPKRKDRGLCMSNAFQGDTKLPQVINCLNWDIALERSKKEKTCPICKLNAVARAVLKENPSPEEKAFFEALRSATRTTNSLKWNIIDRDDPNVVVMENGAEKSVLGFKIATIGPEAQTDITGIFNQVQADITDPENGLDIDVVKDSKGPRVTYSAKLVIVPGPNGRPEAKVTPFTAEERKLELHDLKVRCGKQTDADKIVEALHEDLREIITANVIEAEVSEDDSVDAAVEAAVAEVSETAPASAPVAKTAPKAAPAAPKSAPVAAAQKAAPAAAPTAGKVPSSVLDRLAKKPVTAAPAAAIDVLAEAEGEEEDTEDGTEDAKKK
jgi:hypothetical protein